MTDGSTMGGVLLTPGYVDAMQDGAIHIGQGEDGTITYLVALAPDALPPVRGRDLAAAWDAARDAAINACWGARRRFRFAGRLDLALADREARCWASAVDSTVGLGTSYGISLMVRLLALIDLLSRAPWAAGLFVLRRDGAELHPALLRAVSACRLTPDARLDEPGLRHALAPTGVAA